MSKGSGKGNRRKKSATMLEQQEQESLRFPDPVRLLEQPAERDKVDYKATFSKERHDTGNTVKVYAAMANIGGGLVIYGYDLDANDPKGINQDQIEALDPARLGDY